MFRVIYLDFFFRVIGLWLDGDAPFSTPPLAPLVPNCYSKNVYSHVHGWEVRAL